jgi:hypothetical protein
MSELRFTRHAFERLYERNISPTECADVTHVITAYEPDPAIWELGFRVRKDKA